jgi:hypothetical protein
MARAALFVATSLALHGAAVAVMLAGGGAAIDAPIHARTAREPVAAPEPLLVEGATVEAPETVREPLELASPSAAGAPSRARRRTAARERAEPLRAVAAGDRGPPSSPTNAPLAVHAGGAELPASAAIAGAPESAAGAPRTVFGTAVLRSFLLALSADGRALEDARARYRLHYEGGDGAAASVHAEPEDAAGLRMARALEALLVQASAGLPPLAGTLDVETSRDDLADGVFTITCDDARRSGSVRFTGGRRVRVHELR